MPFLEGKRILFFSPSFFGYECKIVKKMRDLGAKVDFYNERSIKSAISRALIKLSTNIFYLKTILYYENLLCSLAEEHYDIVLFINGNMLNERILKRFRYVFKKAEFRLYLWDCVENVRGIEKKFKWFDKVMSFDRLDCLKYDNLIFRPLFFIEEFRGEDFEKSINFKYDISFCGTIHSDRYSLLNKVILHCQKKELRFFTFAYLQSKFIYYFYKVTKKEFKNTHISNFSFTKKSFNEISEIFRQSKALLDAESPKQSGLTIRTMETLGMRRKLVTSNADIVNYDFYNPNNILVIDRTNPVIPDDFINKPYEELSDELYDAYSLDKWIRDVLLSL